ncbi:hypothetical protein [robinz microvirus RP_133]|nr:hypothetical protein [robinz microvirus RP_133]
MASRDRARPPSDRPRLRGDLELARPVRLLDILSDIEDRRSWHPDDIPTYRPAIRISGAPARLESRSDPARYLRATVPHAIGFQIPHKVLVCAKRKVRRRVIFASGRGGSRVRKPKRNVYSDVRC